ncbi:13106_t:CDS:10 [Entrophospora sp. SA101]|nr:13106_t:CDS:10 [Entrophospora sp. SA101]
MLAICDELNQQKFILDITDDKKNDENGKNNIASGEIYKMSNIYSHRQIVPASTTAATRIGDLLEALKTEIETLHQESTMYKMQRDDLENKVQQQTEEVAHIRQGLYDLQATQKNIKAQYDDNLRGLQRDLDTQRLHSHPSTSSHPQPSQPSHPQPPPPNIGQGPNNLFGGIMSGAQGLAPPQIQAGPPPPPPQNISQGAGNPAPSPYLNGSGPSPLSQQSQHSSKRQRIEDGGGPPGPPNPLGMPVNNQQPPSGIYSNNGLPPPPPPPPQPGQPPMNQQSYGMQGVGQSKPGNKMPKSVNLMQQQMPPNLGPEVPQSSGVPPNGNAQHSGPPSNKRKNNQNTSNQLQSGSRPPMRQPSVSGGSTGLSDMDPDSVPAQLKKEGTDWFAIVVCCVKFNSDGSLLATGCNRSAQIYNVKTGQKIVLDDPNVDKTGDLYIRSVCFSPDGNYLATGAEDKQIRIWDIQKQAIRNIFSGHEQDIYSLDFSRDGRTIVSGSGDRTARIWDMVSGELVNKLSIDEPSTKDAGVTSVAISPDGAFVAAGSLDKIVRVWDSRTGYLLERLEGHKDSVYSVAFSPDGKTLVSGSLDKTLRLWDMAYIGRNQSNSGQKNQSKLTFSGHKVCILIYINRSVQFWDPITAQTQFMLQVISVALSPNNKIFATGSGDCRARLWLYDDM